MSYCPSCGGRTTDTANFCISCGRRIERSAAADAVGQGAPISHVASPVTAAVPAPPPSSLDATMVARPIDRAHEQRTKLPRSPAGRAASPAAAANGSTGAADHRPQSAPPAPAVAPSEPGAARSGSAGGASASKTEHGASGEATADGLPSPAITFWVTFFFGLFGLIPAVMHSGRASNAGMSGSRYWKSFWLGLLAAFVLSVVVVIVLYLYVMHAVSGYDPGM